MSKLSKASSEIKNIESEQAIEVDSIIGEIFEDIRKRPEEYVTKNCYMRDYKSNHNGKFIIGAGNTVEILSPNKVSDPFELVESLYSDKYKVAKLTRPIEGNLTKAQTKTFFELVDYLNNRTELENTKKKVEEFRRHRDSDSNSSNDDNFIISRGGAGINFNFPLHPGLGQICSYVGPDGKHYHASYDGQKWVQFEVA